LPPTQLCWLARHQASDGHWDAAGFDARCAPGCRCTGSGLRDFDTGVTGLALLAFLGAGYTPQNRARYVDPTSHESVCYGEVVRRGMEWIIARQRADGSIGPPAREAMYNHALAALALTEAYGITNAVKYRKPAQKAVEFVVAAQTPGAGWRYSPNSIDCDTSVTGWCVDVLVSARISGLEVPPEALTGAKAWLESVTDSDGHVGYDRPAADRPCCTAIGLACRYFIDRKDKAVFAKSVKALGADLMSGALDARGTDFGYWYHASIGLFMADGPRGETWKTCKKAISKVLDESQRTHADGCLEGSWDPDRDRFGQAGGRVYATAINALSQEVYYRYTFSSESER
jgi:hypothetical protein